MAKRKNSYPEALPIRSSAQIKEDDSRLIFEKSIKPWMISSWIQRDFGIDAVIEITKPRANLKDQIITGKRFSIQLKSSDTKDFEYSSFSLSISIEKINYWLNAIEPVLLVFIDLKNEFSYYRWIDELLIKELFQLNPKWIAQKTISIAFNKDIFINAKSLLEVEKYVIHWKRPLRTTLTPGNYFKYSAEAKEFVALLSKNILKYNIPYLQTEIEELKRNIDQVIYTIGIVGPSRAGKSTLINCLLQKEVSPVGVLPTTGIPIMIFPKDEEKAVVIFKDGTELIGKVNSSFIQKYTSQTSNPNNEKKVNLVSIHIINTLLEKGFALCDVPGLDDPDIEIRTITKTALYNVNAIIYVINVASMRDGGFSITKQIVDDLNELGSRMDKLFLVLNKVDVLTDQQKTQLIEYIDLTLDKFSISRHFPVPPLYISSKSSFENRASNKNTNDSVGVLENQLWKFLLSHNKTGLHKILGSYADSKIIIDRLKTIIGARLLDSTKRKAVEVEIASVQRDIKEIRKFVYEKRKEIYSGLHIYLKNSFDNVIKYMKNELNNIPLNNSLQTSNQISTWLESNVHKIISDIYEKVYQNIYDLQSDINGWISEKLNQVELSISDHDSDVSFINDISRYTAHINLQFQESPTGTVGIVESLLLSLGVIIHEIFTTAENLFLSDEKLRQNRIKEILIKSQKSYNKIATDLLTNLDNYLVKICTSMEDKSIDRTNVYLKELSDQLNKLDKPVSATEKTNFEGFLREINEIENGIESNYTHLKDYTDGIEFLQSN